MAQSTFELDQFVSGYFLVWNISTQCANTVNVKLTAGSKTYTDVSKTNSDWHFQLLEQKSAVFGNEGILRLTITSNQATSPLKQSITAGAINDAKARKVGYVYSICIEDQNDDDYNDVYVNIVAWAKQG
jgi:hypothetical protein